MLKTRIARKNGPCDGCNRCAAFFGAGGVQLRYVSTATTQDPQLGFCFVPGLAGASDESSPFGVTSCGWPPLSPFGAHGGNGSGLVVTGSTGRGVAHAGGGPPQMMLTVTP